MSVRDILNSVFSLIGYAPIDEQANVSPAAATSLQMRRQSYAMREVLYSNSIYLNRRQGGFLEYIWERDLRAERVNQKNLNLVGYFNPAAQIVDTYASIFPGSWGNELKLADKVDGQPVNQQLIDENPLGKIWKWSNLDTEKSKLLKWGPNLGTVGMRITGKDDPDSYGRRVYICVDHPGKIVDFKEDERGNVTDVLLRYRISDPDRPLEDRGGRLVDVEEVFTKTSLSRTYNGVQQFTPEQQENKLGVCPYVILRHLDVGGPWGNWAYLGSESIIHAINYQFSLLAKSTSKNVFPTWFATAGGDAPTIFNAGDDRVAYVKSMPDTPSPSLEALVAKVDYAGILQTLERLVKNLRERQPEMYFNNIELFANISGEALERAEQPTRKRLEDCRPNYDHALTRALKIAMGYMIGMGILDLGTGSGKEGADRAYDSGAMDFQFADRPVLPLTIAQKLQQLQLEQAPTQAKLTTARQAQGMVSSSEQLRMIGKSDEEIAKIQNEKATQDASTGGSL